MIKEKLESLRGNIPGMLHIEVGFDFSCTDNSSDIVLYSEFATKEDLANYQIHPLHKEMMPFIMEARAERRIVDYEINF